MCWFCKVCNFITSLNLNSVTCYGCTVSILISWSLPTYYDVVSIYCSSWFTWCTWDNTCKDWNCSWWLTVAYWVASINSKVVIKTSSQSSSSVRLSNYTSCNSYPNSNCLVNLNLVVNNCWATWTAVGPSKACLCLWCIISIHLKWVRSIRDIWNKDSWSIYCNRR